MAERRRLPVLQNTPPSPAAEEDEARPPWHWVGFGTVAIFAAWLPLAYVGGALSARVMTARFGPNASRDAIELALASMASSERARLMAIVALPGILALGLAAFAGGIVVGRFGSGTGAREAAVAGGTTALIASILAWTGPSLAALFGLVVTFAVAIAFAAWGGRLGASRRSKA